MAYGDGFPCEFPPIDCECLRGLLGERKNLMILEVGSWLGIGSTRVFAEHVKTHGGHLVCFDTWVGSPGVIHHDDFKAIGDPLAAFYSNMCEWGYDKFVTMIRGDSQTDHKFVQNSFFDFVLIDANHQYSFVSKDIKNFLPKVKPGGTLAGHDAECRLEELSEEHQALVRANPEVDYIRLCEPGIHPGVLLALSEVNFAYQIATKDTPGSKVWHTVIDAQPKWPNTLMP